MSLFNKIYWLVFAVILLQSCKNNDKPLPDAPIVKEDPKNLKIRPVEILFDDSTFTTELDYKLLRELNFCEKPGLALGQMNPSCLPKFYKVMPYTKKQNLNDAFMIQVKALVEKFPLRRLFIYQRENSKLICVNQFVAKVIEFRDSPSGYDDLLLVFNGLEKGEDVRFSCLFSWNGKKYMYAGCEEINYLKVKVEKRDSMDIVIKKEIEKYSMAL